MKKSMKIASLILAVILAFSVLMIPASAAPLPKEPTDKLIRVKLGLSKVIGELSDAGQKSEDFNVYKLRMTVDSNYKIAGLTGSVDYDKNLFTPIDHTGGDYTYLCDGSFIEVMYKPLGLFANTNEYDDKGVLVTKRGTMFGLAHAKAADTLKVEMQNHDNTGNFMISWVAGNKVMLPGNAQGEGWFDFYFVRNTGVTEAQIEGATFNWNKRTQSVAIDANPAFGQFYLNGVSDTYDAMQSWDDTLYVNYTYTSTPVVTGPKLVKSNSQIKFYGTKPTANDGFDYRLISKITDADWTTYFANTGKAGATTNAITEAGFVAHDKSGGAFDLATAQNVAKGTPTAGYKTASTTYVSKTTGADATFGCRITDVLHTKQTTDIDCLAYVKYLDNAGAPQYIFYDAAFNAAVATNYNTALTAWQNAA